MKKLKLELGGKMLTKEQMKKISGEGDAACIATCRHYNSYPGFEIYSDCMTKAEAEQMPGTYCCTSCVSIHHFPACC